MSRIELLVDHICSARRYTENLLDSIDPKDWFRQPREGITHVAWQVGHIAVAQYYLALQRIRGEMPKDAELISDNFHALFGKGSVADPNAGKYPDPHEIRAVFNGVHKQSLEELKGLSVDALEKPVDKPHPMFTTKLGALQFCVQHEMLHAGQIGLLRRLLGGDPLR